ncbi:response regulator transcription factor [Vagococcus sp. PNs007]|uniref:Response regulator transcription factor n=1 Tax=Vagococcus proximus TaxID=2991417 RepID=A0ABT5WZ40_9ENTE|nr:response regulator transcription factor [Vagococcus proximus]MDF0479032.1 response regulator transcription factor [Vagococcus proximus]
MTLLIIEDEPSLVTLLSYNLKTAGFEVETATDGAEGYHKALENTYDCLLVDLMLPSMNGMTIVKKLREAGKKTPLIILTAKDNELDKVLALELGADDYITKPFSTRELEARIKAVIRRSESSKEEVKEDEKKEQRLVRGDLVLEEAKHQILKDGDVLELTKTQFKILSYFMRNNGLIISREQLIQGLGMEELTGGTRSIDVHIGNLREKIEIDPKHPERLKTVRGFGYRFESGTS